MLPLGTDNVQQALPKYHLLGEALLPGLPLAAHSHPRTSPHNPHHNGNLIVDDKNSCSMPIRPGGCKLYD